MFHVGKLLAQWKLGAMNVEWSTDAMDDYLHHKKSLASKGKKPKVTTPSASAPSVLHSASPAVSQDSSPSLTSIADDDKIRSCVHSVLASKLSQPGSQISLEANPFFSASSVEVPDIPFRWSTGGRSAESLIRGRISSPGVVPPSSQEDVMPPHVSACV